MAMIDFLEGKMSIFTILLFFVYTYGLGYSILFFIKAKQEFFEKHIMRIGLGLAVMPFLLVLLNLIRVPLDWRIILLISLIVPIIKLARGYKELSFNFRLTKSGIYALLAIVIFLISFFMYTSGAFKYPYLEDDDPWAHSTGIKYVAMEKKIDDPHSQFFYMISYPPGYDAFLGLLHQTSDSLIWTMKFFNALIISLGLLFFYFASKLFFKTSEKALFATLVLAMVPAYLSHFIWAHSMVVTIFLVSLYFLFKSSENELWLIPLALSITGAALTQPTQPVKFLVFYVLYFMSSFIVNKKLNLKQIGAVALGYFLSIIWWLGNWRGMFSRVSTYAGVSEQAGFMTRLWGTIQKAFPPGSGTATRPYDLKDFLLFDKPGMNLFQGQNMINNPVGIGVVAIILLFIGLFAIFLYYKNSEKDKKTRYIAAIFWLLFTFLGVNTLTFNLPIGLFSFRFWMLLAIPLALIAAEGFSFIVHFLKHFKIPRILTIVLIVMLLFFTAGKQKFQVNTAYWGPGAMWASPEEAISYGWLQNLEPNTKVFAYSNDEQVIGYDAYSCMWCDEVVEFRDGLLFREAPEIHSWLKSQEYEYLLLDAKSFRHYSFYEGENITQSLLPARFDEIAKYAGFSLVHQANAVMIFKIL